MNPPELIPKSMDGFLWVLVGLGLGLFMIACVFAIYAVWAGARASRRTRTERALRERWTLGILRVLSGEESPPFLLKTVDKKDAVPFSLYLLEFFRRVRGPERRVLTVLAAPFLDGVAQGLQHPRPERRAQTVYTLGLLAPVRFREQIRASLDDLAPSVAVTAAFALLTLHSVEDARIVLRRLDRFGPWDIGLLSFLLAQVGGEMAADLRDALENSERPLRIRRIAAQALVRLQDPLAGDSAARVLSTETDPELQAAALALLKNLGRSEHVAVVRNACGAPAFYVRAAALTVLGQLGGPEDESFLRDYFDTPNAWVAAHAAEALLKIGALPFLKAVAASNHPRAVLARQVLEAA